MRAYLSGPMTGEPGHNKPAFHERAAEWRAEGWEVFSPAELPDVDPPRSWAEWLRICIPDVLRSDVVAVLPRWQRSKGAALEVAIARAIGIPIYNAGLFIPYYETAVEEALLWTPILGHPVTPEQAILCMVAVKISRECNQPGRDQRVDGAGYFECLEMLHVERARRRGT